MLIMPYESIEPVPKKKMERRRYAGHKTICQKLREIYQLTEDEEIQFKCREAMAMAKRMQAKLKKYRDAKEQN